MDQPLLAPRQERATGRPARVPRLRTPLARAVVPVFGGIAVLGLILLATWGMAVLIAGGDAGSSDQLAPTELQVGSVERWSEAVAETGPLLFPGLDTLTGERTIVLDHTGDDPTVGWKVYWAYPADRDQSCGVEQVRGTRTYVDCGGRELDVADLAPAAGVVPVVTNGVQLSIDLRGLGAPTTTTSA